MNTKQHLLLQQEESSTLSKEQEENALLQYVLIFCCAQCGPEHVIAIQRDPCKVVNSLLVFNETIGTQLIDFDIQPICTVAKMTEYNYQEQLSLIADACIACTLQVVSCSRCSRILGVRVQAADSQYMPYVGKELFFPQHLRSLEAFIS